MFVKKLFALGLALCLLAGCGTGPAGPSMPESPAPPAEFPAPESPATPAPEQPGGVLPQEDPDHPGWLAGAELYYTPGNRLTLYAMAPETGALRTVRQNDFWNGREVESVSPSGRWLLLSSWDGAPGRKVVALSLYDIGRDLLVNLSRENVVETEWSWWEGHWFPGTSYYRFTDDSTFYYPELCCCEEEGGQPHLHRYTVGEDGQVTASILALECPPREQNWGEICVLLPEKGEVLCNLWMGEGGAEWFIWEMESGKLLDRRPGNNGSGGLYRDGVFYNVENDWESETFRLTAYHMDSDTKEVLATGKNPRAPGMEEEPGDSRGAVEQAWLEEIREDGTFVLRCVGERRGYMAEESYRETRWNPATGGEISFGEHQTAPAFPVDTARGYPVAFVTMPDGNGLYLPIPQDMAEYYREHHGQPYPIATLPTGELLFLAAGPQDTLPQEDPQKPGRLAGAEQEDGNHRLTLYAMGPGDKEPRVVRGESFWNGVALEDVSPSGNRLLLATRDSAGADTAAALSVYDIGANRLYNLSDSSRQEGTARPGNHWLPGERRYRFADEDTILYQELAGNGHGSVRAPRYRWTENGGLDRYNFWVEVPEAGEFSASLGCVYLPEEGALMSRLPAGEGGETRWFTWPVTPWEEWRQDMGTAPVLSQTTGENPRYAALLAEAENLAPRPAALPDGFRPPEELGEIRAVAVLQNGEILFLAE